MKNIALTLNEALDYTLTFVCPTCGYMLDIVKNINQKKVVDCIEEHVDKMDLQCKNCTGGSLNYRFCSLTSQYFKLSINGLCFRVMQDGHYLREAFENPCSLNICSCGIREDQSFIILAYNRLYPFVCGTCSKFFLHHNMNQRKDVSFGYIRGIQSNIFIHDMQGQHIDLTVLSDIRLKSLKINTQP